MNKVQLLSLKYNHMQTTQYAVYKINESSIYESEVQSYADRAVYILLLIVTFYTQIFLPYNFLVP